MFSEAQIKILSLQELLIANTREKNRQQQSELHYFNFPNESLVLFSLQKRYDDTEKYDSGNYFKFPQPSLGTPILAPSNSSALFPHSTDASLLNGLLRNLTTLRAKKSHCETYIYEYNFLRNLLQPLGVFRVVVFQIYFPR